MEEKKKEGRYLRIQKQLESLLAKTEDPLARMASICAVLHHKMDHFFWTGFYLYKAGKLVVGPYQGPVACQELEKDRGVCWAALNGAAPVLVADAGVGKRQALDPGCSERLRPRRSGRTSQPIQPAPGGDREIVAILDVDSDRLNSFTRVDQLALTEIVEMVHKKF